ncbi:MAG: 1-aminocyclopropane-1-carboxylate deaminase/D-cysteine desulfhydrase [Chitinophagaceae bacterium]
MQDIQLDAITTDRLSLPEFSQRAMEADMLRLDKIHPQVSGNKWFKLRYYLDEACRQRKKRVVTFGGAWSNHLLATAAACRLKGIACTGVVRGEKPERLSEMLLQAESLGMELVYLDRAAFREQEIPEEWYREENYIIRPGGYGIPGAQGAATIADYVNHFQEYTHVFCAAGTGTMLAGLLQAATPSQEITGISVFKNNLSLEAECRELVNNDNQVNILHDYHSGGYARFTEILIRFMNEWYEQTGIPTDFVYTGKLCFGVHDLVQKNKLPEGSRILIVHSGGLAGNASLKKGTLIF